MPTNYFLGVRFSNHAAIRSAVANIKQLDLAGPLKWLHPLDWHLTLYYFGASNPQSQLNVIFEEASLPSFHVRSLAINVLELKRQDIIMVDCCDESVQLWYERFCQTANLPMSRFHPHITLFRAKKNRIPPILLDVRLWVDEWCTEVCLYQSREGFEHKYHIIQTYSLEK